MQHLHPCQSLHLCEALTWCYIVPDIKGLRERIVKERERVIRERTVKDLFLSKTGSKWSNSQFHSDTYSRTGKVLVNLSLTCILFTILLNVSVYISQVQQRYTEHYDTELFLSTVCTWCCLTMGCLISQWWNDMSSSVWANIDLVASGSWLSVPGGQQ